jgi:aminopeptidase N
MSSTCRHHPSYLLILIFCFAAGNSVAQFKERPRTYDVLHYAINVTIDEVNDRVFGNVTMRLVPLNNLSAFEVDAAEMDIKGVTLQDSRGHASDMKHEYKGDTLKVVLPAPMSARDTLSVTIMYSCTPRLGMYFIHPGAAYPDKPVQVWTQGENEDNRYWLPCYDYPNDMATVEMRVTVNEKFIAVSNGALLEVTPHPENKTKTFFWYSAKPFSSYLISLVVGEYVTIEDWYKHIPVQYNVYPSQKQDARRSFGATVDMIRFFAEKTGFEYPWQKYAQTVITDFTYGGMENISATTLTEKTIHGVRADRDYTSESLVAHELAHQWFGDLLTCRNWSHAWLNEGFATYFESLYIEETQGWAAHQWDIIEKQRKVIESDTGADRRPMVTDNYIEAEQLFDRRIYEHGAAVLHMLRFVMGEQKFWEGMKHYVDLHQYQNVTTDDFQHAMEDVAKQDLGWFFAEWTRMAGYPRFAVSSSYDIDRKTIHLAVVQNQQVDDLTPFYRMPVDIGVQTVRGTGTHRITVDAKREQIIDIPSDDRPLNVVFDKGGWILKTLDHHKSAQEWLIQLQQGDAADRVDALRHLEAFIDQDDVFAAVGKTLEFDPVWGVRKQAAETLSKSEGMRVLQLLAPAFHDSVAAVRVAATASLKSVPTLESLVALGNLVVSDSSDAVIAEAITSLAVLDPANGMKYCEKGLSLNSHRDVIRVAAAKAMGTLKTMAARQRLIPLTAYGQPLEVRQAAIEALADNWQSDKTVRKHLESLLDDRAQRVRRKVLEKLGTIANAESRPALVAFLNHEIDSILRREARRAIMLIDRGIGDQQQ